MATKYAVLESIPFFNVLEKDEMEALAAHMELNSAPKYSNIFSEGDPADYFYILSEGSVNLFKTPFSPLFRVFIQLTRHGVSECSLQSINLINARRSERIF